MSDEMTGMNEADRAELEADPVAYAEHLLMQCLFAKTKREAEDRLDGQAFAIISTLKDALKEARQKLSIAHRAEQTLMLVDQRLREHIVEPRSHGIETLQLLGEVLGLAKLSENASFDAKKASES